MYIHIYIYVSVGDHGVVAFSIGWTLGTRSLVELRRDLLKLKGLGLRL